MFLSGNVLWIEARRKRRKVASGLSGERRDVRAMASLTAAVGAGTPLAIAAMLLAARLLPHEQVAIDRWQEGIYYLVFLGSVLWSVFRPALAAARELLSVLMLALLALLATPLLGSTPVAGAPQGSVAGTLVMLAATNAAVLYWLRFRERKLAPDSIWFCAAIGHR